MFDSRVAGHSHNYRISDSASIASCLPTLRRLRGFFINDGLHSDQETRLKEGALWGAWRSYEVERRPCIRPLYSPTSISDLSKTSAFLAFLFSLLQK